MVFDSKTNKILVGNPAEFIADSGAFFVKVLRDQALKPGIPPQVRQDWSIVESWLDCSGRELSDDDYRRIGIAYRSYLARGVAPSVALESTFKKLSELAKAEGRHEMPLPQELSDVFGRMLATDKEIQQKRALDSRSAASHRGGEYAASGGTDTNLVDKVATVSVVVCAAMLLWALVPTNPYGYYLILRFIVCGVSIFLAICMYEMQKPWWVLGLVGSAIVYNPLVRVHLPRDIWSVINVLTVVLFVGVLITIKANNRIRQRKHDI